MARFHKFGHKGLCASKALIHCVKRIIKIWKRLFSSRSVYSKMNAVDVFCLHALVNKSHPFFHHTSHPLLGCQKYLPKKLCENVCQDEGEFVILISHQGFSAYMCVLLHSFVESHSWDAHQGSQASKHC